MSTERFVETLFARLGDWFSHLPSADVPGADATSTATEVPHG